LIDKPAGLTSFDVVARVRRIFRTRSVGHTGTLDPFATGLLVVLLGGATRLARFMAGQSKQYLAIIRLGTATDTDDLTGEVIATAPEGWQPDDGAVRQALAELTGTRPQRPPAYSAKKIEGRRSYALARKGHAPELVPVDVTVHRCEFLARAGDDVSVRFEVSTGTYIRALARDLGERLGGAAHLVALRREAIGDLTVDQAVTLDRLGPDTPLLPPVALLAGMPTLAVDADQARAISHGRAIGREGGGSGLVSLVRDGRLIAIAEGSDTVLRPVVVLEAAE
jgi:tRNA pseudouridine55 synthase